MKTFNRQPAVALILVLVVMALVGGAVASLTYHAGSLHAQLRNQRMHAMARYCAQSAVAFAQERAKKWVKDPPTGMVELAIDELLPGRVDGRAELEFDAVDGAVTCNIDVRLRNSKRVARHRDSVQLTPGA